MCVFTLRTTCVIICVSMIHHMQLDLDDINLTATTTMTAMVKRGIEEMNDKVDRTSKRWMTEMTEMTM